MIPSPLISRILVGNLLIVAGLLTANCQVKPITKLEKITPKDFQVSSPVVDSNANAVVLADIGSTEFEGNNNGDFTLVFKETKRILLRNRNSFDVATVKVPIYIGSTSDEEESFMDYEAATYNLENGQIKETKLDKVSFFKEKFNKRYTIRKFTFPELKEGCIIEYKFTIKSPYYEHLRSWQFQGQYPVLWSQYQVTIPPMFYYFPQKKGYLKYVIDSFGFTYRSYSIIDPGDAIQHSDIYRFSGNARFELWAMKDVPALKLENYTSTNKNYLSKISFDLISIRYSDSHTQYIVSGWSKTAADVLKMPDYSIIKENNSWMKDDLKTIVAGATKDEEKTRKIYAYIRDNFTCNDHDAIRASQPLKKTFQSKSGNVADISVLLMAMLYNQGIESSPVFLSTRENGWANVDWALLNDYNYVLARVKLDSTYYLLDASQSWLGFGKIAGECLNGFGRVIDPKKPLLIPLDPDSIVEKKSTVVFIINDSTLGSVGSYSSNLGYYESLELRDKLAKEKQEDYINEIFKAYPTEIEPSKFNIDSLKLYDEPVGIQYDLKLKFGDEDIVYFSPLFNEAIKTNPFVSAQRLYPVEMPYVKNETFTLNMEIPKGYKVDEMPKSARVNLNGDEGMFEYIISNRDGVIQLRCKVSLKKATFNPEDYATLRDFFAYVVKKEAEQIVFKKIK